MSAVGISCVGPPLANTACVLVVGEQKKLYKGPEPVLLAMNMLHSLLSSLVSLDTGI